MSHDKNIDISKQYDFIPKIYDMFKDEWNTSHMKYSKFIKEKSMGVLVNPTLIERENEFDSSLYTDYYNIIDKKKWMLFKLKYGI
jgi:hypothetical protein